MQNRPKITVLIPTYNRETLLHRAIKSCLAQSLRPLSIVVGNNGSTDGTKRALLAYESIPEISVVNRHGNIGPCANMRDLLVSHCSSEYAVILSDDDYFTDEKYLEDAVMFLDAHQNVGFVHSEIEYEFSDLSVKSNCNRNLKSIISGHDFFMHFGSVGFDYAYLMTVVFRSELARSVGFFGDDQIPHGDSLAWLKMSSRCDVGFIDRVVARYAMHGGNLITSPNIEVWIKDISFINLAHAYVLDNTEWERSEIDEWLIVQRERYCKKVIGMLPAEKSWGRIFYYISNLQKDHKIIQSGKLVCAIAKSACRRLLLGKL
jgi:glycosyltransferase involved in cell wall biosynthesis